MEAAFREQPPHHPTQRHTVVQNNHSLLLQSHALLRLHPEGEDADPPPAAFGEVCVLATLHRQANVDDPARLEGYVDALAAIAAKHGSVLWPVHPRTAARLGDRDDLAARGIRAVEPQPSLTLRPSGSS